MALYTDFRYHGLSRQIRAATASIQNIDFPASSLLPDSKLKQNMRDRPSTKTKGRGLPSSPKDIILTASPSPSPFLSQSPSPSRSQSLRAQARKTMLNTLASPAGAHTRSNKFGELYPVQVSTPMPRSSSLRRTNNFASQKTHGNPIGPARSLVRSRVRLWRITWLSPSLPRIQEELELNNSSGPPIPTKRAPPASSHIGTLQLPAGLEITEEPRYTIRSHIGDIMPPLVHDDGSDSSGSDEDLDAYEFDLSTCSLSSTAASGDVVESLLDAMYFDETPKQPKPQQTRPRRPSHRRANAKLEGPQEVDIFSIYQKLMQAPSDMKPWF